MLLHFLSVLLSCALQYPQGPLQKLASNITDVSVSTESDSKLIQMCELLSDKGFENGSDVRELFLKVPMTDYELDSLCRHQQKDGSWGDIDYKDTNKGSWQPSLHAFRIHRLAIKYAQSGNRKGLDCALSAMDYWFTDPVVYNGWWHTEVGIPRLLGPAFIILKDEMGPNRLEKAVKVMSAALRSQKTGQNKVWLEGNILILAILKNDAKLAMRARNEIVSEIRIATNDEGLQSDYSFHQHGPQLQFGNYGLSYAVTLSWWMKVLDGTGLDFPEDKKEILRRYVKESLLPLVWNGYFDPNVCYRHVFPNAQTGKALCIRYTAQNLGLDLNDTPSCCYYPCSDFGYYCSDKWYASIKMQSNRTIGFENTNKENMKGYFSSDGALMVRVSGDEYDNIWPVWNWHHIPGVTSWDDGCPIWGANNGHGASAVWPYNKSANIFGQSDGKFMVAAMDYDRDKLTCKKSYFFFEDGIVCLTAGITKPGKSIVTTTIEQNLLKGEVVRKNKGVSHRGISYFILDDNKYELNTGSSSGKWKWMSPALSENDVYADVFELLINHGANPINASCAYAVLPNKDLSQGKSCLRNIQVITNTDTCQCVSIDDKILKVDWIENKISIGK